MASHSLGETTATRLPLTTSLALGHAFLSSLPTETSVEPSVFGRTMRACSIPGSRMLATNVAEPVTMGGIVGIGCEVPTTVYWLTGFVGGVPPTVTPFSGVPVNGLVSLSAWFLTRSPYVTDLPPPDTTPFVTERFAAGTPSCVEASPRSAW